MKVRLIDFMDPSRPLAKASRDLDWTAVVALFPDATHDGLDAARVWVLASLIILGEVTGLSESEVLSRWPENPYWQAFSGFAHFQWLTPITQSDCLAFRRYVDANRAAKLSKIAQSILTSKPLDMQVIESRVAAPPSVDEALALRQVHFLQPMPAQPYKAPPRSSFQTNIKQAYARAAASPPSAPAAAAGTPPPTEPSKDAVKKDDPGAGVEPKPAATAAEAPPQTVSAPTAPQSAPPLQPPKQEPLPEIPESPLVPQFAQTYAPLVRKAAPAVDKPAPASGILGVDLTASRSLSTTGAPQFDTTAPSMQRVAPNEPVKMEVVVTAGDKPLHYQWETFDDIHGTATPIEGCTEPYLTVALEPTDSMLAFQCRVTNAAFPQGAVSRTFFLKRGSAAKPVENPSAEKAPSQKNRAPVRKAVR